MFHWASRPPTPDHYWDLAELEGDEKGICNIPVPSTRRLRVVMNTPGTFELVLKLRKKKRKHLRYRLAAEGRVTCGQRVYGYSRQGSVTYLGFDEAKKDFSKLAVETEEYGEDTPEEQPEELVDLWILPLRKVSQHHKLEWRFTLAPNEVPANVDIQLSAAVAGTTSFPLMPTIHGSDDETLPFSGSAELPSRKLGGSALHSVAAVDDEGSSETPGRRLGGSRKGKHRVKKDGTIEFYCFIRELQVSEGEKAVPLGEENELEPESKTSRVPYNKANFKGRHGTSVISRNEMTSGGSRRVARGYKCVYDEVLPVTAHFKEVTIPRLKPGRYVLVAGPPEDGDAGLRVITALWSVHLGNQDLKVEDEEVELTRKRLVKDMIIPRQAPDFLRLNIDPKADTAYDLSSQWALSRCLCKGLWVFRRDYHIHHFDISEEGGGTLKAHAFLMLPGRSKMNMKLFYKPFRAQPEVHLPRVLYDVRNFAMRMNTDTVSVVDFPCKGLYYIGFKSHLGQISTGLGDVPLSLSKVEVILQLSVYAGIQGGDSVLLERNRVTLCRLDRPLKAQLYVDASPAYLVIQAITQSPASRLTCKVKQLPPPPADLVPAVPGLIMGAIALLSYGLDALLALRAHVTINITEGVGLPFSMRFMMLMVAIATIAYYWKSHSGIVSRTVHDTASRLAEDLNTLHSMSAQENTLMDVGRITMEKFKKNTLRRRRADTVV